MELCVEVVAGSWDDLSAGRFRLVVGENLGSALAGSTVARFAHLMPELDEELTRLAVDGAPHDGAVPAQVAFRSRSPRAANIAAVPQRLPLRIPLGVGPAPADATDIPPDALAVVATTERLHVIDTRTGIRIVPVTGSMLNPGSGAVPPLARFLIDIGRQDTPHCQPWTWGPFRHLPHLPRVRYGRTVLAPARWLPSTRMLDAASDSGIDAAGLGGRGGPVARRRGRCRAPCTSPSPTRRSASTSTTRCTSMWCAPNCASRGRLQLTEVITPDDGPGWLRGPDGARTGEVMVQLLRRLPCGAAHARLRPGRSAARPARRHTCPAASGSTRSSTPGRTRCARSSRAGSPS